MPGFSIEEFKGALSKKGGPMRRNKALLVITPPPYIQSATFQAQDDFETFRELSYWCDAFNLPGATLATKKVRRWTFGVDESRPFVSINEPVRLSFIWDADGLNLQMWNNWLQNIIPHDWYEGGFNQASNFNNATQYFVRYKNEYAVDPSLFIFNQAGEAIYEYKLKEAFPSAVEDIPFGWNEKDNVKFNVQLEYLDWVCYGRDAITNSPVYNPPDDYDPNSDEELD